MDIGTRLFRSVILGLAGNAAAAALSRKYGLKLGASRFVAGQTRDEALTKVLELNERKLLVTMDHLGEGVRTDHEADRYCQEYVALIEAMANQCVQGNVSLKPTQMGLALSDQRAYDRIRHIAAAAADRSMFVRLDMEDSPYTDRTLHIVKKLHADGLTNTGPVIQAYLRRSEHDVRTLTSAAINVRLVKGAYKEPASIAYPKRVDVDSNFKRLIRTRLDSGVYTAVATHDEAIIDWVRTFASRKGIPSSAFEFQMLYGIRTPMQLRLAEQGYTVRSYVPYGTMWYPYFIRRLAERPANVGFVVRSLLKRH
ncbi:proline dehydrogenase family protein [Paenibacillus xylaniclasticus]|uniref:proline dehydrogenase family protein n=1 Tax=Paenibacillus xylaniclasticus TaxID=588083 RepID=UPI000FD71926|nr:MULTISPECIES: proline dehydrogenase family protein [Paenibacillus]GFN31942.1 proline dehydrogenase [Paenibacillus curdlanolyticus]